MVLQHLNIRWRRAILLLLVFVSIVIIINHTRLSAIERKGDGLGDFFEDFGDTTKAGKQSLNLQPAPLKQQLNKDNLDTRADESNDQNENRDNSLDLPALDSDPEQKQKEDASSPQPAQDELPMVQDQQHNRGSTKLANPAMPVKAKFEETTEQPISSSTEHTTIDSVQEMQELLKSTINELENLPSDIPIAIPYILHQSAQSEMLPESHRSLLDSCLTGNPDWQYYMWRDQDQREFMRVQYPLHMDWFFATPKRQQDRLFRYFVLQSIGGLFLDLDMQCLKPLTPLFSNASLFVAEERPEMAQVVGNVAHSADSSAVAGAPGHELFSIILEALTELPTEPIDTGALLTKAFEALSSNCTLQDYRYFGPALDNAIPWQGECNEVLNDLKQGPYASDHGMYYKQLGCMKLRDKAWSLLDKSNMTVALHTYLSLDNFVAGSQGMFNITEQFGSDRVTYYNRTH